MNEFAMTLYDILTNPPCGSKIYQLIDEKVAEDPDAAIDALHEASSRLTPSQFTAVEDVLTCILSTCFSLNDEIDL